MSLFDFLKYSSTNLNSESELSSLPPNLYKEYRRAAYAYFGNVAEEDAVNVFFNVEGMARYWHSQEEGFDANSFRVRSDIIKQTIFNKVLKDYDEPI